MKICNKCKIEKELSEFGKNKQSKDGINTRCKECVRAKDRDFYKNNSDKVKQYQKKYNSKDSSQEKARLRNRKCYHLKKELLGEKAFSDLRKETRSKYKDWELEYSRQYHKDNKEALKLKDKIYRETYPEKVKQFRKNWNLSNLNLVRKYCQERKARKLQAMPSWSNEKYINLFFEVAKLEEERTGQKCHVDHIVPLKSHLVCGLHVEYNLQVLFAKDNISKGNRFWPDMPDNIPEILEFYGLK